MESVQKSTVDSFKNLLFGLLSTDNNKKCNQALLLIGLYVIISMRILNKFEWFHTILRDLKSEIINAYRKIKVWIELVKIYRKSHKGEEKENAEILEFVPEKSECSENLLISEDFSPRQATENSNHFGENTCVVELFKEELLMSDKNLHQQIQFAADCDADLAQTISNEDIVMTEQFKILDVENNEISDEALCLECGSCAFALSGNRDLLNAKPDNKSTTVAFQSQI